MDLIKTSKESHICIQNNEISQNNTTVNLSQAAIKVSAFLYDALVCGAGSLTPEEQKRQKELTQIYLKTLRPGNGVRLGLNYTKTGRMEGGQYGAIVNNDGEKIKVQADFLNKKHEKGIRSFSAKNGYSIGPAETKPDRDKSDGTSRFFIMIPDSHTIKSSRGMPQEVWDEINELYRQAGDPKTCYDLVNNLKYGIIQNKKTP